MRVQLHIERLVIDDSLVASHQREHFQHAIENELVRLLADQHVRPVSAARLTSAFRIPPNAGAERIGTQLAEAVHGSISKQA